MCVSVCDFLLTQRNYSKYILQINEVNIFNDSFEWIFDEASCFKQGRKRTDCLSGVDRNKSKFSLPLDCLKSRRTCELSVKVKKDSRQASAFKYLYLDKKDPHV